MFDETTKDNDSLVQVEAEELAEDPNLLRSHLRRLVEEHGDQKQIYKGAKVKRSTFERFLKNGTTPQARNRMLLATYYVQRRNSTSKTDGIQSTAPDLPRSATLPVNCGDLTFRAPSQRGTAGRHELVRTIDSALQVKGNTREKQRLDAAHSRPFSHNLPARSFFVPRPQQALVKTLLLENRARIVIVGGPPGVGKSSLALEVAHNIARADQVSASPFKYIVWINDKDSSVDLDALINKIAYVAGEDSIARSSDAHMRRESALKLLNSAATLLIVDNFESVTDKAVEKFIRQVPEPSRVMITSTARFAHRAHVVDVDPLNLSESSQLIQARLGELDSARRFGGADWNALAETACGNPMVLLWGVSQVIERVSSIEKVCREIRDGHGALESLFHTTWSSLSAQAKRFGAIVATYPAGVTAEVLSAISPEKVWRKHLDCLRRLWLVEPTHVPDSPAGAQYGMLALTRFFVLGNSTAHDLTRKRTAIIALKNAAEPKGGFLPTQAGISWLDGQTENLLSFSRWCCSNPRDAGKIACANCIATIESFEVFLWGRGYWSERAELARLAHQAASHWQMHRQKALQSLSEAWIRYWQHDLQMAATLVGRAERESRHHRSNRILALSARIRGLIATSERRFDAAKTYLQDSLKFTNPAAVGVESKRALMCEIGTLEYERGRYQVSRRWLDLAVKDAEDQSDAEGLAINQAVLARTLMRVGGEYDTCERLFNAALTTATGFRRLITIGRCNLGLAEIILIRGGPEELARQYIDAALDAFRRLGASREQEHCLALANKYGIDAHAPHSGKAQ